MIAAAQRRFFPLATWPERCRPWFALDRRIKKSPNVRAKHAGQPFEGLNGHIFRSPFDAANVGRFELAHEAKCLLRQSLADTQAAQIEPDKGADIHGPRRDMACARSIQALKCQDKGSVFDRSGEGHQTRPRLIDRGNNLPFSLFALSQTAIMGGFLGCIAPFAIAQAKDNGETIALGVVAFHATENACEYSSVVAPAIAEIDGFYKNELGADWETAKRRMSSGLRILMNVATIQAQGSSPNRCKTLGLPVGDTLGLSFMMLKADPRVEKEAERLSNGGGRVRVSEIGGATAERLSTDGFSGGANESKTATPLGPDSPSKQRCTFRVLRRTVPEQVEAGGTTLQKGQIFGPISSVEISNGTAFYCEHGAYCYSSNDLAAIDLCDFRSFADTKGQSSAPPAPAEEQFLMAR